MNYFYIQPRQSGKTLVSIAKFLENPNKSLFIVASSKMKRHILQNHKSLKMYERRIVINNITNSFRGSRVLHDLENIIIDDYFCCKVDKVWEEVKQIRQHSISEISIFSYSTPPLKQYNEEVFKYVKLKKEWDEHYLSYLDFAHAVSDNQKIPFSRKEFEYQKDLLYRNLITEPNTKIIKFGVFQGNKSKMYDVLPINDFRTQIEGQLFKETLKSIKLDISENIENLIEFQRFLEEQITRKLEMKNIERVEIDVNIVEKTQPRVIFVDHVSLIKDYE